MDALSVHAAAGRSAVMSMISLVMVESAVVVVSALCTGRDIVSYNESVDRIGEAGDGER
jgi:hypothetical protein